jgi:hypothetical protein
MISLSNPIHFPIRLGSMKVKPVNFRQPSTERGDTCLAVRIAFHAGQQHAELTAAGSLRQRLQRPSRRRTPRKRDELTPPHSIT